MKYIVLIIIGLACFLAACEEKGIMEYSDGNLYLSFLTDSRKDSTILTFKTYPEGKAIVKIPVKSMGVWLTEDREFTVSANANGTTLPAELYQLPEKCVFSAGQDQDTLEVTFLNGSILAEKTYRLELKIDEGNLVKEGDVAYRKAVFLVSDRLERPKWWTEFDGGNKGYLYFNIAEEYYLGKYSEKKYIMFLEELAKDNIVFDGKDRLILKTYSIRLKNRIADYNKANPDNKMWDEENNEYMTVPVVG